MSLLIKPDPFPREIDRLFGRLFDAPAAAQRWAPAMDLIEAEDHYLLKADLPGMSEDDVAIEFERGSSPSPASARRSTPSTGGLASHRACLRTLQQAALAAGGHRRRGRDRHLRPRRAHVSGSRSPSGPSRGGSPSAIRATRPHRGGHGARAVADSALPRLGDLPDVAVIGATAATEHVELGSSPSAPRNGRRGRRVAVVELGGLVELRVALRGRVGAQAADPLPPAAARLEHAVEVRRVGAVDHVVGGRAAGLLVDLLGSPRRAPGRSAAGRRSRP